MEEQKNSTAKACKYCGKLVQREFGFICIKCGMKVTLVRKFVAECQAIKEILKNK